MCKGIPIKLAGFSAEIVQVRGEWHDIFKVMKPERRLGGASVAPAVRHLHGINRSHFRRWSHRSPPPTEGTSPALTHTKDKLTAPNIHTAAPDPATPRTRPSHAPHQIQPHPHQIQPHPHRTQPRPTPDPATPTPDPVTPGTGSSHSWHQMEPHPAPNPTSHMIQLFYIRVPSLGLFENTCPVTICFWKAQYFQILDL